MGLKIVECDIIAIVNPILVLISSGFSKYLEKFSIIQLQFTSVTLPFQITPLIGTMYSTFNKSISPINNQINKNNKNTIKVINVIFHGIVFC